MELPLTPLDFARRARKLYPQREALVDGPLRLTYAEFCDRCDRWAAALQRLGVKQGDRVVVIAPNTHAMLEAFYAVPQAGQRFTPAPRCDRPPSRDRAPRPRARRGPRWTAPLPPDTPPRRR